MQKTKIKYGILIPSYKRVELCRRCIDSIMKNNNELRIDIFVTVEVAQYQEYYNVIGSDAIVVPLAKTNMGVSYSIHYGLMYMYKLGYKYVIRTDDDVLFTTDVKRLFTVITFFNKKKKKYGNVAWIGAWFSIYDFYYKNKIKKVTKRIYEAVGCLYSRCYIIDLDVIIDLGNWDWRYRYWDDYDMVTRLKISGYKIFVDNKFLCGSIATRGSVGGVSASMEDKVKVVEYNMELLKDKFGDKIANYYIKNDKIFIRYNWKYIDKIIYFKKHNVYKNLMTNTIFKFLKSRGYYVR